VYDGWRVGKVEENGRVLVFVDDDRITKLMLSAAIPYSFHYSI
jgi:hypothetical protein